MLACCHTHDVDSAGAMCRMLHLYRINADIQISSMLDHFPPLGYLVNTTFHHETLILCDCVSADRGVKGGHGPERRARAAIEEDIGRCLRCSAICGSALRPLLPSAVGIGKRESRGVIVFNLESTRKENKINTEAVDDDAEAFISRSSDSQMGNRVLILEGHG